MILLPTAQQNKSHYLKAWGYLFEFKYKSLTSEGIEISERLFGIEDKAKYVRDLLSGMGFTISFDKNSGTITIK